MRPAPTIGVRSIAAAVLLSAVAVLGIAQESEEAATASETDTASEADNVDASAALDEVVVIAPWPGGPRSLDPLYEDSLKERIKREVDLLMQDQEESEWRAEFADEKESRIKLGYDPRDEYRLRNELDLNPPPSETAKPATLIRIGF